MSISTPDPIQQMVNKQEIRARDSSLSVVKVRAHIIKNPDENEKNNNIADQLAKLAAQKGDEWKPDRLVVPAVSAIQTIPIDLKQYQQELWSSDGELTPHLQQDQLVKVTEGMILRDNKYIVPEALQKPPETSDKVVPRLCTRISSKNTTADPKKLLVATNGIRHSKMV